MNKVSTWIVKTIPVLAPIPAMWSVYEAAHRKLNWPEPVAGAAGLAVEGLGFAAVNLAERMYTHNKGLRADERAQKWEAPTWKAMAATGLYLIVVVAMIILVDILPTATGFLPVAFPFLGVTGAAVWAMQVEQDERERAVSEYRAKKAETRKRSKEEGQVAPASDKQEVNLQASKPSKGSKLHPQVAGKADKLRVQASKQPVQEEALLAYWRDNPQASDQQVASHFGRSRQGIQQRREGLIRKGAIRMTEGGAVEIVGISVELQAVGGER